MKKISIFILFLILISVGTYLYYLRSPKQEAQVSRVSDNIIRATDAKVPKNKALSLPVIIYKMPPVIELNEIVQKLVGFDVELSLNDRNNLVWNLKNQDLREEDFSALYAFLKSSENIESPQLELHSLKNDLLVFLIDCGRYKESTAQLMLDIINDSNQHPVLREYTLQYTIDYFEKHWLDVKGTARKEKSNLSQLDEEIKTAFVESMWSMLSVRNGAIAGTALIRLNDISKHFKSININEVEESALSMIQDDTLSISSRMAALSIASERRMKEIYDYASEMVFDEHLNVLLRVSALNTISTLGPNDNIIYRIKSSFLENKSADERLKTAAELALKKI